MHRYDPERPPNAREWLALDEQMRIGLAEKFHRTARIKLPNLKAHAIFHTIIENQIAEGHESVVRAMARLAAEGHSRHDALHAVGTVLAVHIHDVFNDKVSTDNSNAVYSAAVERLTAKTWRDG